MAESVKTNLVDKVVNYFSPQRGSARLRARMFSAVVDDYIGASRSMRSMFGFLPKSKSQDDTASLGRELLLSRSRYLVRNNAMAFGSIDSNCVNIVGTGLGLKSRIDRKYLGLTNEAANEIESRMEREFSLFADSPNCDVARTLNFYELTNQMLWQSFEAGEIFTLLPYFFRNGDVYGTKIQLIESERVCNEDNKNDTDRLVQGIEKDEYGAPVKYHICSRYPGGRVSKAAEWSKIDAYRKNGLRNVLHHFIQRRPGQSRGIPYHTPIIELLYNIGNLRKAELDAYVVQSLFAVLIETEGARGLGKMAPGETGARGSDEDIKLAPGAVIDLKPGEKAVMTTPGRPGPNFDSFLTSLYQECGVGSSLPLQVFIKKYDTSFTSARAAFGDAWKFWSTRRGWVADSFCNPVYSTVIHEAVARGRLALPGFLSDPLARRAYLGAEWVGPAQGQINPVHEMTAAKIAVAEGWKTDEQVTEEIFGGDFDDNMEQRKREIEAKTTAGILGENRKINLIEKNEG